MPEIALSIDDPTRTILANLAEALLPLEEWVKQKEYVPPEAKKLPWRKDGSALSVLHLKVIDFFEALLRESAGDAALLDRWAQLRAQPLQFNPHERPDEWRRQRGLDPSPTFGVVAGDNVLTDSLGRQVARTRFYADYLPLLRAAAEARKPQDAAAWKEFALELYTDRSLHWPGGQPPASGFVFQFTRDLLYAVLGMRNPVPEPWRSAVLTKLGEFRRPGNVFTRQDVEHGLEELKAVLDTYFAPAEVAPEPVEAELVAEAATEGAKIHYLEYHQRRL